jgi:hypothetical protein
MPLVHLVEASRISGVEEQLYAILVYECPAINADVPNPKNFVAH